MSYEAQNLADLAQMYRDAPRTAKARQLLDDIAAGRSKRDLAHLLRHHDDEAISDRETWWRDAFDYLLEYYSLLEIASLIRYVPDPLPPAELDAALKNLSHPAIKQYYERHYPLMLPRLLRARLTGKWQAVESGDRHLAHELFARFLGILNHLTEDEEIEVFQWFLDGGTRGDHDIDDTIKILRNPRETFQTLQSRPKRGDHARKSVHGAQKFLGFCAELDQLLADADKTPLFRSAMWTFHSYWFDRIEDSIAGRLEKMLDGFLKWGSEQPAQKSDERRRQIETEAETFWKATSGKDPNGEEARKRRDALSENDAGDELSPDQTAIEQYVKETRRLLKRLQSKSNAAPLKSAAKASHL
jgi:hypothetical protein